MQITKNCPGTYNAAYVAGMNVTPLPTMTFKVSNAFAECNVLNEADSQPLGTEMYTLLMYSTSVTAFSGSGQPGTFTPDHKLGGFVIK